MKLRSKNSMPQSTASNKGRAVENINNRKMRLRTKVQETNTPNNKNVELVYCNCFCTRLKITFMLECAAIRTLEQRQNENDA